MYSQSEQDYLKAIYEQEYERGHEWVTTSALAQELGVSPASVTEMVKKLADPSRGLLSYERYRGVRLSEAGVAAALQIVRHHRLVESFLSEALGFSWDEVHAEAHRLEHVISETMEERIAAYLGHPRRDPHGSPIPQRDGGVEAIYDTPLTALPPGQRGTVSRVLDEDPDLLRYLAALGLTLGVEVEVAERAPFDGPITVRLIGPAAVHALGAGVTDKVFVKTAAAAAPEASA